MCLSQQLLFLLASKSNGFIKQNNDQAWNFLLDSKTTVREKHIYSVTHKNGNTDNALQFKRITSVNSDMVLPIPGTFQALSVYKRGLGISSFFFCDSVVIMAKPSVFWFCAFILGLHQSIQDRLTMCFQKTQLRLLIWLVKYRRLLFIRFGLEILLTITFTVPIRRTYKPNVEVVKVAHSVLTILCWVE